MKEGRALRRTHAFSLSEIQFNQRHLCAGSRAAFPWRRLKQSLSYGAVFEVQGNYHFLPITVPAMEREHRKTENQSNLLHPGVPGRAPDT